MAELDNPERTWERPDDLPPIDRDGIERRLGRSVERFEALGGGLANLNVRVDGGQVLRIYLREQGTVAKEVALLSRPWKSFRVPAVLATGDDFVLLEHVEHRPLEASAAHGERVGRALCEIHAHRYPEAGLLGGDLTLSEPFGDFVRAMRRHADEELGGADPALPAPLASRALALLDRCASELSQLAGPPVLLHGDFKASNLHCTRQGQLLVLDWEFAYAGSALMDLGQVTRWFPPAEFVEGFVRGYLEGGGRLPDDWLRWAAMMDLVNLFGLAGRSRPRSRRAADIAHRIQATIDAFSSDP